MSRYNLEISENERLLLIIACGASHGIGIVAEQTEPPAQSIEIARRLVELKPAVNNPRAPSASRSTPPPPPPAAPAAPVTHARQEIPEGAIELAITPRAIEKSGVGKKECLVLTWQDGPQKKQARCWIDSKPIWPRVLARVTQPSTFYALQRGAYLNIVGVK